VNPAFLYKWFQKHLFSWIVSRPEQLRKPAHYAIMVSFVLVSTILIFQRQKIPAFFLWQEGDTWNAPDLHSPITFAIEKDSTLYQQQLDSAIKALPLPFSYISQTIDEVLKRLEFTENLMLQSEIPDLSHFYWLPDTHNLFLLIHFYANKAVYKEFKKSVLGLYEKYYIVDQYFPYFKAHQFISIQKQGAWEELHPISLVKSVSEAKSELMAKFSMHLPKEGKTIFSHLLNFLILPNLTFQADLHETQKKELLLFFPKHEQIIKKGELLIRQGERITAEKAKTLSELRKQLNVHSESFSYTDLIHFFGLLLLIGILLTLKMYFIRINRSRLFQHNRNIALILSAILVVEILAYVLLEFLPSIMTIPEKEISWLIPVAIAPMFVTIFHDDRLGFITALFTALIVALQTVNPFSTFIIHAFASSAGVFFIYHLTKRSQFFLSIGFILLIYCFSHLALTLITYTDFHHFSFLPYLFFLVNVVLVISSYPLIYFFEKFFGIHSDLTFLELLNQDHELLKRLAKRAQGTFHHSVQVANLAEACAEEIGANALLVRVGALFHDIGKMENPQYFIENQKEGKNPHDALNPIESAHVIIRHVTYGAELAQQYGLPDEIIRFIRTHHGTTRVGYFYFTYLAQQQKAKMDPQEESQFRYPGPTPLTKEEGILMLADSVEAASRALDNPTPEKLEQLVDHIIEDKLSQRQFEQCELSFRDLELIRNVLKKQLTSLYHQRVEYPEKAQSSLKNE